MTTPTFKIKLKLNDSDHSMIMDAIKDGGSISKLKVRVEATHSGIINKNNFFYIPKGMKNGAKSFIQPFPKPVLVAHNRDQDAIGRVLKSKYIDYPEIVTEIKDSNKAVDLVDQIIDFTKSKDFKSKGYKGLGHIELIVEITDEEAIEKVLDKRYLTVSISGDTTEAVCSICGTDKKNQPTDYDDQCHHWRGEDYDGQTAFLIAGDMIFDEVSYVNTPADTHAVSEVIKDSVDGSIQDSILEQDFSILDFETRVQNQGDKKLKLADLFSNKKIVAETLELLGLKDFIISDERTKKLRKTSFLFAKERAVPVNDKAHMLAASKILDQLDDSEDFEAAKTLLDGKFERAFGKNTSFEDALATVKPDISDDKDEKNAKDTDNTGTLSVDYDKLADNVVEKLKSVVSLDDSFAAQRAEALEVELEALEAENDKLTDNLKKVIIDQILSREEKLEDSKYRKVLESRGINSLNDKLNDLLGHVGDSNKEEENVSDKDDNKTSLEDNAEDSGITDTDINIDDAAENKGEVKDDKSSEGKDELEDDKDSKTLSVKDVRDSYRSLFKSKGPAAAAKYIRELTDNKTLPENFSFAK
jgi:hypothetical protein